MNRNYFGYQGAFCCILSIFLYGTTACAAEISPETLLRDWAQDPGNHPNIPFVAYAGLRPEKYAKLKSSKAISVKDFGAKGDGKTDDTSAIQSAIDSIADVSSGDEMRVVFIPAGNYILSNPIYLDKSFIILQGEDKNSTVFSFSRPLRDIFAGGVVEPDEWAWHGGLLWAESNPNKVSDKLPGAVKISSTSKQGESTVTIDEGDVNLAQELIGKTIHLRWSGDIKFLETIFGHQSSEKVQWSDWKYLTPEGICRFEQPNVITAIEGNVIKFEFPLRIPIKPEWNVVLGERSGELSCVGIENITISFPSHPVARHLEEVGFNAIFFRVANSGWIKNLKIVNSDCGIVLERSSRFLISDIEIDGQKCHHGMSFREISCDNLAEKIQLKAVAHHGLSVQDLSCGNVYSNSTITAGGLDSHRGMPFDNVWTQIEINARGNCGGAQGPLAGRKMTLWNIKLKPEIEGKRVGTIREIHLLSNPLQLPTGAIVGILGMNVIPKEKIAWTPPGEKGCVVYNTTEEIAPANLYEAQRSVVMRQIK
jgi:hypothetical protein